jgi:enterochelin esterase-like enzyme
MLLAWWFLALLIGAAGAIPVAGTACAVRRRHHRRAGLAVAHGWRLGLRRAALVFGTVTFTLAAILAAVNDHYSYIPSFHALFGDVSPDLVAHPIAARSARRHSTSAVVPVATNTAHPAKATVHGVVEKVSVGGPNSGVGARDTYVYLPPEYFDAARANERFPVLYLIHGSPGVSVDWIRAGWLDRSLDDLLSKHEVAPFIVVMPDANGGFRRDTECQDIPGGPRTQTYLVTDVVNYVDANYRTIPDRRARVMGGLSTGGYCAINLVLRHQDVFSGLVSHSGYDRPDHNLYTGELFGGDRGEERANTPGEYLPTVPLTTPLGVYVDVGASDKQSRNESIDLTRVFEQRRIPVTFHDFADEAHNWSVWRRNLYSSLPWVSAWFVSTGSATAPADATAALVAALSPDGSGDPKVEAAPSDDDLAPPDADHVAVPSYPSAPPPPGSVEQHGVIADCQAPAAPSRSASGSIVSAARRRNSTSSSRGTGLSSSQCSTHSSTIAIHPRISRRRPGGSSDRPRAAATMSTTAPRVASKTSRSRSSEPARRTTAW